MEWYIELALWASGISLSSILTYYITSRIGSRLGYRTRSLRLIGKHKPNLPKEINILFKDKKVPRLTKTFVTIWNSGKKTIPGENIIEDDRLRICFDEKMKPQILYATDGTKVTIVTHDGKVYESDHDRDTVAEKEEILKADVIKKTKDANKFEVKINESPPHEAICSFEYLDSGDGVLIELLHTGENSPKVKGTIKELPQGVKDYGTISSSSERKSNLYTHIMDLFMGIVGLYLVYFMISEHLIENLFILFLITFMIFIVSLSLLLLSKRWMGENYHQAPKALSLD